MNYVTVSELRSKPGAIWRHVEAGGDFVITRNGKACALLLHTKPAEVEDRLRAARAARFALLLDRIHAHVNANGPERITAAEVNAEIAAVRRHRRSASADRRRR